MTESLVTGLSTMLEANQSLMNNSSKNFTTVDLCVGAGKYADGTCRTIWPFWVEVTVPLCCVLVFLLTLAIVYLRPFGTSDKSDASKQQLNTDDTKRTEPDQKMSYRPIDDTSLDTKV